MHNNVDVACGSKVACGGLTSGLQILSINKWKKLQFFVHRSQEKIIKFDYLQEIEIFLSHLRITNLVDWAWKNCEFS